MGFFDDLKQGLSIAGGTVLNLGEAVFKTAGAAVAGFAAGGPAGALLAGIPAGIASTGTLIHRLSAYFHPTDEDGTPNMATIQSLTQNPLHHLKMANQALQNVNKDTPESGISLAQSAAKLNDGLEKYGDFAAAAKFAGASPISKHIATGVSKGIVDEVKRRTGFDAINHMRYGRSATRAAQMVPTTSAYAEPVRDYMLHGGAEALAMKHLSQNNAARNPDLVIS